ncbi:glycine zipper domain-containing protein [Salinicola endophyticus]|uniref:glycine zipper domain-containing protein n=1 Tax=Salinicola endophyticus TaxID=1949083 RepID=UPI000DA1CB4F|nr:DUF883 family protein [Salinicola endophyticus]
MSLFKRDDSQTRAERIRDDIHDIGDQSRALGRDLRDETADAIEEARLRSEEQYARTAAEARRRQRRLRHSTHRSLDECDRYVHDHPWRAIGAAAAAGAVIGLLLGRR